MLLTVSTGRLAIGIRQIVSWRVAGGKRDRPLAELGDVEGIAMSQRIEVSADRVDCRHAVEVDIVPPNGQELTCRGLVALGREQLVGDAHFVVIRLGRGDEQRCVVGLPSKPGDRTLDFVRLRVAGGLVAGESDIRTTQDSKRLVARGIRRRFARIALSGICSMRPRHTPEWECEKPRYGLPTPWRYPAAPSRTRRIRTIGDAQQGVDSSVRRTIRIFTKRATRTGPSGETNDGRLPARLPRLNLASAI